MLYKTLLIGILTSVLLIYNSNNIYIFLTPHNTKCYYTGHTIEQESPDFLGRYRCYQEPHTFHPNCKWKGSLRVSYNSEKNIDLTLLSGPTKEVVKNFLNDNFPIGTSGKCYYHDSGYVSCDPYNYYYNNSIIQIYKE